MKPSFRQKAFISFVHWFDHKMCENAESFVTEMNKELFVTQDDRVDDDTLMIFAANNKSWIADSSITGAFVAKDSIIFTDTGEQINQFDKIIDYSNSRVMLYVDPISNLLTDESGVPVVNSSNSTIDMSNVEKLTISAISTKELNVYTPNQSEDDLIVERSDSVSLSNNFINDLNEDLPIKPYDFTVPCAFLSMPQAKNEPYAIGGEDQYKITARAVILTRDLYELDVTLGTFEDLVKTCYPLIDFEDTPFDEYCDLKFDYNYKSLENSRDEKFFIEEVYSSKAKDVIRKKVAPSFWAGFLDFEITISRYPRI